ncbi:hypothetical protein K435DRAFT_872924 [Dendrothele bispora CBS 962.96]|uniref:Uncharacterized protein n=1 Tax=Dendrothele bispora (strain CBS 962.96) TaxID=1314807 RepID=A0A4S8L0R9_DENBC|nr:hypothetical protein K435DRAFT_872924 [Dendrothele bispora CBS 962.96]
MNGKPLQCKPQTSRNNTGLSFEYKTIMQLSAKAFFVAATFAAVAMANPAPQQGTNCREVFFPDQCASNEVLCDGAAAIQICCTTCF